MQHTEPARKNVFSTIRSLFSGNGSGLLFAGLAELCLLVPGLLIPAFSQIYVDDVLIAGRSHWLGPLLATMVLSMVLRTFLVWLQYSTLAAMETRFALVNATRMLNQILRLPMSFFFRRFAGELISRVELCNQVAKLVSKELAGLGLRMTLAVVYGLAMFVYSPILGCVGMASAVVSLVVVQSAARVRLKRNRKYLECRECLLGMNMAGVQNMLSIKATGAEQDFFNRWAGHQANAKNALNRLELWGRLWDPVPALFADLSSLAILGVGAFQVMEGDMAMGEVVAVYVLQGAFFAPVRDMVDFFATFQTARGYLEQLDEILEQEQDACFSDTAQNGAGDMVRLQGQLELENVSFGYDEAQGAVVKNISLALEPGARVALVGATGSGKSTVASLVVGLYEAWEGRVLFDGKPASDVSPGVMQLSRRCVSQKPYLFEGTVHDNISMWNDSLDQAAIVQAAKDACVHDVIAARPGGYESRVEEAGSNFSGGQRQRLELARALATNPALLVLDEATSALDPRVEQQIDENLRRRGITCLIIAHRLSTIRDCDEIIVLERGRVVERGTHKDLYETGGIYARLVEQ